MLIGMQCWCFRNSSNLYISARDVIEEALLNCLSWILVQLTYLCSTINSKTLNQFITYFEFKCLSFWQVWIVSMKPVVIWLIPNQVWIWGYCTLYSASYLVCNIDKHINNWKGMNNNKCNNIPKLCISSISLRNPSS